MSAAPTGLPPLNVSSGPAVSEAGGGFGEAGTGAFHFKSKPSLFQQILPFAVLGVAAWLILKR